MDMKKIVSIILLAAILLTAIVSLSSCDLFQAENPYELDFYPLPDGTYAVSAGRSVYLEEIEIPATYKGRAVTQILPNAFEKARFTSITIPDSVTSIGDEAFLGCTNLTSVTIGDSVTSIGFCAFLGCTNLTSITIPDSVTSIRDRAFHGCTGLTSITIGNSMTHIGSSVFSYCRALTDIYFTGTEEEWNAIDKSSADIPSTATIHYNYVP